MRDVFDVRMAVILDPAFQDAVERLDLPQWITDLLPSGHLSDLGLKPLDVGGCGYDL